MADLYEHPDIASLAAAFRVEQPRPHPSGTSSSLRSKRGVNRPSERGPNIRGGSVMEERNMVSKSGKEKE